MWQALLEEGTIASSSMEHCFKDKYLFYRFTISGDENRIVQRNGSKTEKNSWENQQQSHWALLVKGNEKKEERGQL